VAILALKTAEICKTGYCGELEVRNGLSQHYYMNCYLLFSVISMSNLGQTIILENGGIT
jgi:hypothetical protein